MTCVKEVNYVNEGVKDDMRSESRDWCIRGTSSLIGEELKAWQDSMRNVSGVTYKGHG